MANTRSATRLGRSILRTQPDERLVALTREGHDAAYEEIVRRHRARLVRQAAAIVPAHRAEDVVQECLAKALGALRANEAPIALSAWLATIVRNRSLNDLRDEPGPHEQLDLQYDGVPQPPAVAAHRQEVRDVVAAISALPEQQRRALVGRELEGKGHDQIAAELGVTQGAARGLIFRARAEMRDALGAMVPLPAVRFLLEAGAAETSGGAAAGAGAAIAGMSTGTKAAVGVLAVLATVGSTVAIERNLGGGEHDAGDPTRAHAASPGERPEDESSGDGTTPGPGPGDRGASGGGNEGAGDGASDDEDERDDDNSGPGGSDDRRGLDDSSGPGGGESSGHGSGGSSGHGSSGGNSGPGGGDDGVDDPKEPDGDDSGPGGGDDSSGSSDDEPDELEDE